MQIFVVAQMFAQACTGGKCPTGIGEISYTFDGFVSDVARIAVGIGGVAAIGLVAYGAFTLLTSTGDPEKLMSGREIITNALIGLALISLAVVVLSFLGWDFLGLGRWAGINFGNIGQP